MTALLTNYSLCVCAILRTIYIYRVYYNTYDMTWESQPAWMWLAIEAEIAIVCASAPSLRVFFKKLLDEITTKRSASSSGEDNFPSTGSYPKPERKSSTQKLGMWDVSLDSERGADYGDEHEFVTYDYSRKEGPAATGGTFYEETDESRDEPDLRSGTYYTSVPHYKKFHAY
jgi:hypothetical protein